MLPLVQFGLHQVRTMILVEKAIKLAGIHQMPHAPLDTLSQYWTLLSNKKERR